MSSLSIYKPSVFAGYCACNATHKEALVLNNIPCKPYNFYKLHISFTELLQYIDLKML